MGRRCGYPCRGAAEKRDEIAPPHCPSPRRPTTCKCPLRAPILSSLALRGYAKLPRTRRAAPPSGLRFSHRVPQHAVSPVVAPSSHPQEPDQCRQPKRGLVAFRTQCDIAATRSPARPFELSGSASQSTAPSARTEAGFIQAPLRGRAPDAWANAAPAREKNCWR